MKVNYRSQIIKYLFFSSQAPATYKGLVELEYLDMIISETLRLYPVSARISRISKKDAEINGVFIPQNTKVEVPVFVLHRDPKYWPEPEKFCPERYDVYVNGNTLRVIIL